MFIIIPLLTLLDLLSKYLATHLGDEDIRLVGDLLMLRLSHNTGVAFSMPLEGILLKAITIILIAGVIWYYRTQEALRDHRLVRIGYSLILSGAFGNAVERIFIGRVTDWIAVKYFAIFNFADIFISVGAACIILFHIVHEYRKNKSA